MKWLDALALSRRTTGSPSQLLLISSLETHTFAVYLKAYAANANSDLAISSTEFGDLQLQLHSVIQKKEVPCAAVIVADWDDFIPGSGYRSSKKDVLNFADIETNIDNLLSLLDKYLEATKSKVIFVPPLMALPPLTATPAALLGPFETAQWQAWSGLLALQKTHRQLEILNPDFLFRRLPNPEPTSVKNLYRTGWPYTNEATDVLASATWDRIQMPAPNKKIIITDLDNCLWHGLIEEVGTDNVSWEATELSFKHLLYQRMLNQLMAEGILVAVCSKNDGADVAKCLQRSDLLLKPDKLIAVRASWQRKSEAIHSILQDVNLLPGSALFIDDSPFELAEVAASLPDIATLRFPDDNGDMAAFMLGLRSFFQSKELTREDKTRVESYHVQKQINAAAVAPHDFREFLNDLKMTAHCTLVTNTDAQRPLQLLNKTNQFHLHGKRLSDDEWQGLFKQEQNVLEISLKDKLCDYGIIAVCVYQKKKMALHITHLAMSCRVFSRTLEHGLLGHLHSVAERLGCESLIFEYERTKLNDAITSFIEIIGCLDGKARRVNAPCEKFVGDFTVRDESHADID